MGRKRRDNTSPGEVVIGRELAAAHEAEGRRLAEEASAKSPMPAEKYTFDRPELSLLRPTRHTLDGKLVRLCKRFARAGEPKRAAMRHATTLDEFYTLLEFARRAAVFAIRESDVEWAAVGLTAVAMIEAERVDWRDVLVALGVLHHAATRAGTDADQLFRAALPLAEPGTAELIAGFIRRPTADKRLSAWGYEEVETDAGVGLMFSFGSNRTPKRLLLVALDVTDLLATDRYRPTGIDGAGRVPDYWLEMEDNTPLERALEEFQTGATVRASLRQTSGVGAGDQGVIVFLQQMKTKAAAQQLLDIARKKRPRRGSFVKVEAAAGRLFCLLIARSFDVGVKGYETAKSVRRFAAPLSDILRRHAGT